MATFIEYCKEVLNRWAALVTGGVFIAGLSIYQGTGHLVAHWVYWVIAVVAIFLATYKVWLGAKSQISAINSELLYTKLQAQELTEQLDKAPKDSSTNANANRITSTGIGNVYVGYPQPPVSTPRPPTAPPQKKPTYNVNEVGRRVRKITEPYSGADVYEEALLDKPYSPSYVHDAVLVDFRNQLDPDRNIDNWEHVSASIRYETSVGKEVLNISAGMWLKTRSGEIDFNRGQNNTLVLAMRLKGEWFTIGKESRTITTAWEGRSSVTETSLHKLDADELFAEVILHDHKGHTVNMGKFPLPLSVKE